MTRDDIIRMAREAGFQTLFPNEHIDGRGGVYVGDDDIAEALVRFAALVTAAEREACAALLEAEREAIIQMMPGGYSVDPQWVCDAIRARGNT